MIFAMALSSLVLESNYVYEKITITNSSDSFTNLKYRIYDFSLTNICYNFFFNCSNGDKFVEKFVKQIGENI